METDAKFLEQLKKATGANEIQPIGIDDTFGFKCQQCGQCCMNRDDIILNPFDVFNGARYLGITCEEFVKNYTHVQLGSHSKIPMVLLRSSDNGFCPLLKFDIKDGGKFKCSIHPAKPGACANHPIGIARQYNVEDGSEIVSYVKVDQCSNSVSDEQQLVRDWVKASLDHQEEIAYAHKLQTGVSKHFNTRTFWLSMQVLVNIVRDYEQQKDVDKDKPFLSKMLLELPKTYLSNVVALAYLEFDTSKPYIEQAKENLAKLDDFCQHTKEMYEGIKTFQVGPGITLEAMVQHLEDEASKEEE